MDLSKLSLAELKNIQAQLPKEIASRQKEEKAKLLKELEAMAYARGFDLAELVRATEKKERTAIAVKYRNPTNSNLTWSGRGRKPIWVAEFLQNGGTLEQISV